MKWVDQLEEGYPEMVRMDVDIRDLVAAVRILETALEEVATVNHCDGTNHKITHDVAVLALKRANELRNDK